MSAPNNPNYPQAPLPYSPTPKTKSRGLAIAALVLGIVAVVFSWIPFVNIMAIIVGLLGLVLGIIAIFVSNRPMAIIGAVLSVIGIIVAFSINNAVAKAIDTPTTVREQNGAAGTGQGATTDTYEYQVNGSGNATVSYGIANGSGVSSSTVTQKLPWSKTVTVDNKGIIFVPTVTASTMNSGTVSCKIIHNGKTVAEQSASGQFATVSCSGS